MAMRGWLSHVISVPVFSSVRSSLLSVPFYLVGFAGVFGPNLHSMLAAAIGAVVMLVTYHAVIGRRAA